MTETKTSKRKMTAAERKLTAVQRRIGGWTFQKIGKELGVTKQAAHKLVMNSLQELNEKTMESAEELRRLERERLDTMLDAIWANVKTGDYHAIDRALKIQARRAALEGLDAPKEIDVKSDGEQIGQSDEKLNRALSSLADAIGESLPGAGAGRDGALDTTE